MGANGGFPGVERSIKCRVSQRALSIGRSKPPGRVLADGRRLLARARGAIARGGRRRRGGDPARSRVGFTGLGVGAGKSAGRKEGARAYFAAVSGEAGVVLKGLRRGAAAATFG